MKPEEIIQREKTSAKPIEPGCTVYVERLGYGRYVVESVEGSKLKLRYHETTTVIPISWAIRVDDI